MIRNGFLIKNGCIFDTMINSYKLEKEFVNNVLLLSMSVSGYKRLYEFEVLLLFFENEKVFEILSRNSFLKKQRVEFSKLTERKKSYISTSAVVYNYPVRFLTLKKFNCYKICQKLKKRLD